MVRHMKHTIAMTPMRPMNVWGTISDCLLDMSLRCGNETNHMKAARGYHRALWLSMLNPCIVNTPLGLGVVLLR
jgi:hypothetical protein